MNSCKASIVILERPLNAVGKIFKGSYSKSEEYLDQIRKMLTNKNYPFSGNKDLRVYYDNPEQESEEALKSFQGFFS